MPKKSTGSHNSLAKVQKSLGPFGRNLSKLVHRPSVDTVSNIIGSTIGRPKGLLFGAAFSFISSTATLIFCNYYGYEYNHLIGIAALIVGYAAGLFVELAGRIDRLNKN